MGVTMELWLLRRQPFIEDKGEKCLNVRNLFSIWQKKQQLKEKRDKANVAKCHVLVTLTEEHLSVNYISPTTFLQF